MAQQLQTKAVHDILTIGRHAYLKQLVAARAGNISVRLEERRFMITAQGVALGFLKRKDLLVVNRDGKKLHGAGTPSSETRLHAAIYNNTTAGGIVHVHPPYTLSLAHAGVALTPVTFESKLLLGNVPCIAQKTPTVMDIGPVVEALSVNNVVILKDHGIVSVGETIWDAFLLAELLEEASLMTFLAHAAGAHTAHNLTRKPPKKIRQQPVPLFSAKHRSLLTSLINRVVTKERHDTVVSFSIGFEIFDLDKTYSVLLKNGRVIDFKEGLEKESFVIGGTRRAWCAVCNGLMDPLAAVMQGKMTFSGTMQDISTWYPVLNLLFSVWKALPVK